MKITGLFEDLSTNNKELVCKVMIDNNLEEGELVYHKQGDFILPYLMIKSGDRLINTPITMEEYSKDKRRKKQPEAYHVYQQVKLI